MLYMFNRYNVNHNKKNVININYNKKSSKKYPYLYLYPMSTFCSVSIFSRKSHFRTLLVYMNMLYSNLNLSVDSNIFYTHKIVIVFLKNFHPSFLAKKRAFK